MTTGLCPKIELLWSNFDWSKPVNYFQVHVRTYTVVLSPYGEKGAMITCTSMKYKHIAYILKLCWESSKANTCRISLSHTINITNCCWRNAEPSTHCTHRTVGGCYIRICTWKKKINLVAIKGAFCTCYHDNTKLASKSGVYKYLICTCGQRSPMSEKLWHMKLESGILGLNII